MSLAAAVGDAVSPVPHTLPTGALSHEKALPQSVAYTIGCAPGKRGGMVVCPKFRAAV